MEVVHCQDNMAPHSDVRTKFKRIHSIGADLAAGDAGNFSVFTDNHLRDPTPDFLSGFSTIAFSIFGYGHKAVMV